MESCNTDDFAKVDDLSLDILAQLEEQEKASYILY